MKKNYQSSRLCPGKENKYDQTTNFMIELHGQLNQDLLLPNIYSKYVEIEATNLQRRRKDSQRDHLLQIKSEINHLKQELQRSETRKMMMARCHTEQPAPIIYDLSSYLRGPNLHEQYQPNCFCQHSHRCCCQQRNSYISNHSSEKSSTYLPLPSLNSKFTIPQPPQKQKPSPKANLEISSPKASLEKPIKKKRNKKILKKFRVAVFAVYFALLLPALAQRIYRNRLKLMMKNYPHQVQQYSKSSYQIENKYDSDEKALFAKMEQMLNFPATIKSWNAAQILKDGGEIKKIKVHFMTLLEYGSSSSINNKENLSKKAWDVQKQIFHPKVQEKLLPEIRTFLQNVCACIAKIFQNQKNVKEFGGSVGLEGLNNSFVNNSYPKILKSFIENGLVQLHSSKETIIILQEEVELLILAVYLIAKVYCFSWLLKIEEDQTWADCDRVTANFTLTLLYACCMQMCDEQVQKWQKSEASLQVIKSRNRQLKPIKPLIMSNSKTTKTKSHGSVLIEDLPFLDQTMELLKKDLKSTNMIKESIAQNIEQVRKKLKLAFRLERTEIKEQTLKEKLFSGSKPNGIEGTEKHMKKNQKPKRESQNSFT